MNSKRLILMWLFAAMMLGQILFAGHHATHIDHGISSVITVTYHDDRQHDHNHDNDSDSEDDKQHDKHECPECVLTNALQTAYFHFNDLALTFIKGQSYEEIGQSQVAHNNQNRLHFARAPPFILI